VQLVDWEAQISLAVGVAGWEAMLAVLYEGEDVPTAVVARRLGVSTERAARVLGGLPSSLASCRRVGREHRWGVKVPPGVEWSVEAARERLDRLRGARGRRRRADRSQALMEDIDLAHDVLRRGDPARCARVIRERGLDPGALLPRVTPSKRDGLRGALAMLHADLAMQRGEWARTIGILRRVLPHLQEHAPREVSAAYGVLGAALRMAGGRALEQSLAAFDAGLDATSFLPEDQRTSVGRWLLASRSTPSAILGRWDEARRDVAAAKEMLVDADATAVVETLLLETRALLGGGHVTRATGSLAEARGRVAEALPWVRGWFPRYEADVLSAHGGERLDDGFAEACIRALETAWERNAGFGFQRRLILARIAAGSIEWDARLAPPVMRSIVLEVGALHRDRVGLRLEDCPRCREDGLRGRIVDALGLTTPAAIAHYR